MKQTEQTLLEQMRISEFEVEQRQKLFSLSNDDIDALQSAQAIIDANIDTLVSDFYSLQTSIPEISLLIGDSDTLTRLSRAQRRYVIDLFSGIYDLEYVNNRLRIGMVHKRIGVEPKLYLSAIYTLKNLLIKLLKEKISDDTECQKTLTALEKILLFDVTLVFDTYIRSLVTELEISKAKSEQYARDMEEKVRERTLQLEHLSRTDPLTGLLNVRHLRSALTSTLRAAQRRSESVAFVYLDINDFKEINDQHGHQKGDETLRSLSNTLKTVSREEDSCFRYGGDEFCIILPNCTKMAAENIYSIRLHEELAQRGNTVTLSIGVVETGPIEFMQPDTLIDLADKKMYELKQKAKLKVAG